MRANFNKLLMFSIQTLVISLMLQILVFGMPKNSQRPWNAVAPDSLGDVNLFNGTLNLGIPLINVGGRGGTQVPLTLTFNRHWKKYYYTYIQSGSLDCPFDGEERSPVIINGCSQNTTNPEPVKVMIFPRLNNGLEWNTSWEPELIEYGPGILVGKTMVGKNDECTYPDSQQKSYRPIATRFYIEFTTSDGSSTELIDQNTYGKFRENSSTICNQYSVGATFSRGSTFVSTNGTAMKFVSDNEITSDPSTSSSFGVDSSVLMSGFLYMANGSIYRIEGGMVSWIKDSNGNKTIFSYYNSVPASQPKKLHTVTDSVGRTVTIEYNVQDIAPFDLCDRITYKSFGGEDKIIRISKTNLSNALRSGYTLQTPSQMWPATCEGSCGGNSTLFNPIVSSTVWLPDGRAYKFQYNSFVEVSRIEFPAGGVVEYDHDYALPNDSNYEYSSLARSVKEKRVYTDASSSASLQSKTKYSRTIQFNSPSSTTVSVDQTDADNNLISRKTSYFYGDPKYGYQSPVYFSPYGIISWRNGYEYQTKYFADDGVTLRQKILNESINKTVPWFTNQDLVSNYDSRQTRQVLVTIENGKALAVLKKTEYDENGSSDPAYFSHLNIKKSKAYNYKVLDLNTAQTADLPTIAALFNESDLASVSETDYLYNEGYKDRHILGLPTETRVMNPASPTQFLAKSQIVFDEQNQYYSMADYGATVGYEAPTGNYAHLRGNTTTYRTWFAEENRWIETHAQSDNFGNVRKVWDSSGDPNRFVETEYSSQHFYAYPTKKIAKAPGDGTHGTTETSTVTTAYDFYTGRPTSITDANGQVTTMEYDDLLRPKKVIPPAGGSIAERIYGDTPGDLFVKTRAQVDAQNWAETTTFFDNLGRVYKTQTKDLQGDIFSEIEYDSFGRVERVSNPYRQGEQKYWSKPRYDIAGRVVETYAPALDGQTGASMGTIEFGISTIPGLIGNYVTATDASGRKARSVTNVFGQVVRVDEPTGNNDLGTLETPNQASYYTYNIKGELVKIQQAQQNRFFTYDSLGRLTRVRQPEQTPHTSLATTGNPDNNQWTSGFSYDVFGNVITVTDAKGMVITNNYDKAGRIITSGYNDGITPQSNYYYDGTGLGLAQAPPFSKGSLTKISNGVSEERYTSFDNYGRLLASQQMTDGQTYNFGYKYDDKGNLIEETYPSGRVVKTHLDADGGLSAVSSKTATSPYKTYASNFSYAATGAVKAMMLGNGRWETAIYNERFQTTQIGLGNNSTDTSLWKVNYDYGELNTDGTVDAAKNIGNVAKQTITVPTTSFVQTYKYDALNRLTEARETANTTGGVENWKQTFGYDRYGNRTAFYQKIGSNILPIDNKTKPTVDPATNRFTTGQGYTYDFNGNLIQDAENRGFTYNGDDRQTVVRDLTIPTSPQNPDTNVIGRYYYDGEGKRVKKVTPTETVVFVYNAAGALAAEYSTAPPPASPTTSYLTTDNLGSPRVITDKTGAVISRRDFMPFGEEILGGVGARDVTNLKYTANGRDNVRQRFTGYQKDIETDLDFAEARMYQNRHGRFTAPDPLLSSASLDNPQTFNRYVYVGNNPVNLTDPSGLDWCVKRGGDGTARNAGSNVACGSNEDRVTSAVSIKNGKDSNGRTVTEGETVDLHDDGTLTVRRPITQQEEAQVAAFTGTTIQATSDPIASTIVSLSTTVQTRSTDIYPALTISEAPEPLVSETTLDTIQLTLAGLGQIPGPGEVADVIDTLISLTRGDYVGAGAGVVSVIPVIGNAAGAAKIARKLERLTDAAGDAKKLHNNPTPVSTKEAVKEAHKEVGKQAERGTGKFGSPMRGNSKKGYRLDPPNPKGKGLEKTHKHVNWWDYTKGKKGKGGRKGYIPIK